MSGVVWGNNAVWSVPASDWSAWKQRPEALWTSLSWEVREPDASSMKTLQWPKKVGEQIWGPHAAGRREAEGGHGEQRMWERRGKQIRGQEQHNKWSWGVLGLKGRETLPLHAVVFWKWKQQWMMLVRTIQLGKPRSYSGERMSRWRQRWALLPSNRGPESTMKRTKTERMNGHGPQKESSDWDRKEAAKGKWRTGVPLAQAWLALGSQESRKLAGHRRDQSMGRHLMLSRRTLC